MKTKSLRKSAVVAAPQKRRERQTRGEDRHKLESAIKLARADYIQRFPETAPSPAEKKARAASLRALFQAWEEENARNPPSREEVESYDRMLARMREERAS